MLSLSPAEKNFSSKKPQILIIKTYEDKFYFRLDPQGHFLKIKEF